MQIEPRRPGRPPKQISEASVTVEDIPVVSVRRFNLPDLSIHGLWLHDRLKDKYPHVSEQYLAAWIRGAIETNQYLFICTEKAVGLAQANHRPLEPKPFVEEIFVFTMEDGDLSHLAAIYREFKRWGKGMDASEIVFGELTDARQSDIKKGVGDLYVLKHYFSPID